MRIPALVLAAALAVSCAQPPTSNEGALIENFSDTSSRVQGLLRTNEGPFVRGSTETLRAKYDAKNVKALEWSASAGTLNSRGDEVTWTLPDTDSAELTLTLTLDNAERVVTVFGFKLISEPKPHGRMTASEALLATPMPVLDGGVAEISGGACEAEYDATGNVHLAFTTETHPSLYYGKWNGTTWTLEVVDAMGFNTGGLIRHLYAQLRVDSSNNPHIVYVRDDQVWYATRAGTGPWTRERVDTSAISLSTNPAIALALNAMGRPTVIFQTGSGNTRLAVATRAAANSWTVSTPNYPASIGTLYQAYLSGDVLIDPAGKTFALVQVSGSGTSGNYISYLAYLNGAAFELVSLQPRSGHEAAWAGANRMVVRSDLGVYDIALAATFANTTFVHSTLELNVAGVGDIAWNGRPVVLHHHSGGALELITPQATGASFWSWQQLGSSNNRSASVTVHPTTGVPSICYQSSSRVMFQ